MSRHRLTKIDFETRTALCSVCGPTEIQLSRPRTENPPKIRCVQRAREQQEYLHTWKQRRKTPGRPKHTLMEINEDKRTAVCAICGPTDVYRVNAKGYLGYRCATYLRALARQTGIAHIVSPHASVHILSEIDEDNRTAICAKCGPVRIKWYSGHLGAIAGIGALKFKNMRAQENFQIVSEYKRRHACKRCGSMAVLEPHKFDFFEMQYPREQRIPALVEEAEPEELVAELEKRDMYCTNCLWLVNDAFANNTPAPEFRPIPTFF